MRAPLSVSHCLLASILLLASPSAKADFSDYCSAFFDELEETFETEVVRTFSEEGVDETLNAVTYLYDGKIAAYEIDAATAADLPGADAFTVDEGKWLALCVDGPWEPPAFKLTNNAALALARPVWRRDGQTQLVSGVTTFLHSVSGAGLLLRDASVDLDSVPSSDPSALMVLKNTAGLYPIEGLEITGSTPADFTVVRQWKTATAAPFRGTLTLDSLRWETVEAASALYRATCPSEGDTDADCAETTESLLAFTLSNATLIGTGSETQQSPLVSVVGDLLVSGSTLRDLSFVDPALEATGTIALNQGTALVNLTGSDQEAPAVKAGEEFQASTTLFSGLAGWQSLARADQQVRLEQSYVCGATASDSLLEAGTDESAEAEIVTTAVVQSRFFEGLVTARSASVLNARLANLTLLGVQTPFDSAPKVDLVHAPHGSGNTAEIRSLLSADSAFAASDVTPTAEDVLVWSTDSERDCQDAELLDGCAELAQPPEFTGQETLLGDSGFQACIDEAALLLAELMQAESRADRGESDPEGIDSLEEQTQSLARFLPALLPGQDDLLGTGGAWNESGAWNTACACEAGCDIGAYSGPDAGTCSLSFLAPFVPTTEDTGDSGTPADGTDGTDGTDGASSADSAAPNGASPGTEDPAPFGIGRGCRYGSAGALLLLPLVLAVRRRSSQQAHRAGPSATR